MRTLIIPKKDIKEIKKLMETSKVEYGGWFEYEGVAEKPKFKNRKQFIGELLSVSVPTENYEIHWHTHASYLISSGTLQQTGPIAPPSRDDIAQTSYKYYSTEFLMGHVLRQVVFTRHAIYIQEPINSVLDNFFKTKDFMIADKKDIITWTNKWYNPFKKEADKLLKKLFSQGLDYGYIDDDTGKYVYASKEETKEMYQLSLNVEKEYMILCEKYGVKITKITNWKKVLKDGLSIKVV